MPTNVNDATYFELRLIQEICLRKKINFRFTSDLNRYVVLLTKSHGNLATQKISIQENRLKNGLQSFMDHVSDIENALKLNLIDVDWVGRKDMGDRVADIDLILDGSVIRPISVKSGGQGTERNLGGDSLRALIEYDSSAAVSEMKEATLSALEQNFPGVNFGESWEDIRKVIVEDARSKSMRSEAKKIGKKYQLRISEELFQGWHNATDLQKLDLIKYLSLQNDLRDLGLEVFVAEDNGAYFKGLLDLTNLSVADINLSKHSKSNNGTLEISICGKRYWRLNVNFTNGIGLSPIAIRVFRI